MNVKHSASQLTLDPLITAQVAMKIAGRRRRVLHHGALCSKCLNAPPRAGQRYCRPCHTGYVKVWRKRTAAEKGAVQVCENTAHI